MPDHPKTKRTDPDAAIRGKIGELETRKLRARRRALRSAWFGFRMFGMVGWSVVIPTVFGALFGHWLDTRYPSRHSWTLTLIILGLVFGCLIAWRWIAKEAKAIHSESEDTHE